MTDRALVMIVEDDNTVRESLEEILGLKGYSVTTFVSGENLLSSKNLEAAHCFILDIRLPGMSGVTLLEKLHAMNIPGPVIMMTGHGDISTAVDAMKKGAYDFVEKPFEMEVMLASVARGVEKANFIHSANRLRAELDLALAAQNENPAMVGKSQAIEKVREGINAFAKTEISVLVTGETGVGKELVAREIHNRSRRAGGKFVAVNMASLPESLAMAELFGSEKGAFTGAVSTKEGKFEYASGGTLLLDEINSAPLSVQAGILRAIEEKKVTRLGSNESISIDARIVAAANRDIRSLTTDPGCRADLFHRLGAAVISIPPLRERMEDVPLLATSFLRESCKFYERGNMEISAGAMTKLLSYPWPGNVRELKNTMASLALKNAGDHITDWEPPTGEAAGFKSSGSLRDSVNAFEKEFIENTLRNAKGNLKEAAARMEIPPRSLFDKMRKYGLTRSDFR